MKRLRRILFNTLAAISLLIFAAVAGAWARSHWKYDLLIFRLSRNCAASLESCRDILSLNLQTKVDPDESNFWETAWFTEPQSKETLRFNNIQVLWEPKSGGIWYGGEIPRASALGLEIPYYMLLISSAVLAAACVVKFYRRRSAGGKKSRRHAIFASLAAASAILFIWAGVSWVQCALPRPLRIDLSGSMPVVPVPRPPSFEFRGSLEGLLLTGYLPLRKEFYGPSNAMSLEYARWEGQIKATNFRHSRAGFRAERTAFYFPASPGFSDTTFAGYDYLYIIPYWAVMIVSAVAPSLIVRNYIRRLRQNKRARSGLCRRCGYDLRATRERCPECGMAIKEVITCHTSQG